MIATDPTIDCHLSYYMLYEVVNCLLVKITKYVTTTATRSGSTSTLLDSPHKLGSSMDPFVHVQCSRQEFDFDHFFVIIVAMMVIVVIVIMFGPFMVSIPSIRG